VSLRLQLFGTIALVLLATLVIGALLTYRHAIDKIDTEMRAAIAVGSRIAHNAVDDVEEVVNPRRRLELLAADFDGDRHLRAFLVEPGGTIPAVSKLAPPENPAPDWLWRLLAREPMTVTVPLPSVFSNYGAIRLETDSRNEISEVWEDVQIYFAILSFFCLSSLLVTLAVLSRGLEPLRRLTTALDAIGRGGEVPEVPVGPLELQSVTTGFNRMVARLTETEEKNRALRVQLDAVQEEERGDLARNLHDEVSPLLFCIGVDARALEQLGERQGLRDAVEQARSIQKAVKSLKSNVKNILGNLRPKGQHALGLHGAVEELVAFWTARHPELKADLKIADTALDPRIEAALQAIIGESINNAMKHGSPKRLVVKVQVVANAVKLEVSDNGGGFRKIRTIDGGYGILGMKERAHKLRGTLSVAETQGGRGVTVRASLPLGDVYPQPLPHSLAASEALAS
jgi:two-component system sensor histidine kinase UhpB